VFIAIEADLYVRYGARDGAACAEFSWQGFDDSSPTSGRGWAALGTAGRLVGHIFIHNCNDSGFVAERERLLQQPALMFAFKGLGRNCLVPPRRMGPAWRRALPETGSEDAG
jgi:hypothetical protein